MLRATMLSMLVGIMGFVSMLPGYAQESSPVRCRDALRPALLQANPDPALLIDIQRVCEGQAAAGDPDALYQLSLLHLGLLDWQPDKAIPMIRSAAESGVSEAQYWMAWQREAGPLLYNDAERALHWYLLAGEQEHRLALDRLAGIYANGELDQMADKKMASQYRARAARCKN